MRARYPSVVAGLVAVALLVPVRLIGQGKDAALLEAEGAASSLSSDSGLAAALLAALEPAGVLLWPGAPVVVGARNVRRLVDAIPGSDSLRLTWQPLGLELDRDSTLGVTWGLAVGTSRRTPSPPQVGRYLAAWHRGDRGWRMAALLFIGIKPVLASAPRGIPLTLPPARAAGPAAAFVTADLDFARLAGDSGAAIAFERWAARDAIVFGERGLLTQGPQAIARGVAGDALWRWHPVLAGASASGDLGWTVGEAVIAPKQGEPSYSKYLTVWVKPSGGPIRFITDGGSSRPPGP